MSIFDKLTDHILPPPFHEDFIVVCEFCQKTGPEPVLVIPNYMPSTDQNSNTPTPKASENSFDLNMYVMRLLASDHAHKMDVMGCSGGWTTPEDSQVVLSDNTYNVFAYAHHITLHDIQARGYVRPICMAYVTRDPDKIMQNFESILRDFSQVSAALKCGNSIIFLRELQQVLNEAKCKIHTSQSIYPELDQDVFKKICVDFEELQQKFEEQLSYADSVDASNIVDHNISNNSNTSNISNNSIPARKPGPGLGLSDIKLNMKYLQLSQSSDVESVISSTASTVKHRALPFHDGNFLSYSTPHLDVHMPSVLRIIYEAKYDIKLRGVLELCGKYLELVHSMLGKIYARWKKPAYVLAIEQEDFACASNDSVSSNLMIGKNFVLNFDLEEQSRHDLEQEPPNLRLPNSIIGSSSGYTSGAMHISNPVTLNAQYTASSMSDMGSFEYGSPSSHSSEASCYQDALEEHDIEPSIKGFWKDEDQLYEIEQRRSSQAKARKTTSSMYDSFQHGVSNMDCGRGIAKICSRYSFSKHMVYSLLKGRPLIIYARQDNEIAVREIIIALSVFVAGDSAEKNGGSIVSWRTRPLQMNDLAKFKLVGLSKPLSIPKSVARYVSILDFEESTLWSPTYRGNFVEELLTTRRLQMSEPTFLAYIRAFLLDLGIKACLYYHMYCLRALELNTSQPSHTTAKSSFLPLQLFTPSFASSYNMPSADSSNIVTGNSALTSGIATNFNVPSPSYSSISSFSNNLSPSPPMTPMSFNGLNNKTPQASKGHPNLDFPNHFVPTLSTRTTEYLLSMQKLVLEKLGVVNNDVDIVEYLCELIKEQQMVNIVGEQNTPPTITLDFSPCRNHKNNPK